jgi:hypothetical protein
MDDEPNAPFDDDSHHSQVAWMQVGSGLPTCMDATWERAFFQDSIQNPMDSFIFFASSCEIFLRIEFFWSGNIFSATHVACDLLDC